jgi:cytochrome P450/NADPH-cytochrome P450 reductase
LPPAPGLAPVRGAITDRRALAANGTPLPPALCYFGCDAPDTDFLHAEKLRRRAGGRGLAAARLQRDPVDGQRFVQDRIAAQGDEVWDLLTLRAIVYVCGDGRRMAPAFATPSALSTRGALRTSTE